MPLVKLKLKPGFDSLSTQTENASAWFNGNLLRWRLGHLEKYPGWQRLISQACQEHIRVMHAWEDLSLHRNLLIGTDAGPQILVDNNLFTLEAVTGTPVALHTDEVTFAVGAASTLVTATATLPAGSTSGVVTLLMQVSIGGIILPADSSFPIATIFPGGFTFSLPHVAAYSESGTNGVAFFTFTPGSNLANVRFRAHGLFPGQFFLINARTALGAGSDIVIPAGTQLQVVGTPDADNFTFDWTPYGTLQQIVVQTITEGSDTLASPPTLGVELQYNTPAPSVSSTWFSDNLGQNGLMLFPGSPVFVFFPPINNGTFIIAAGSANPPTAPQASNGMFTAMPQAQIIAFGSETVFGSGTIDPLLLRWSDAGSFEDWTATVFNQAGSYRLSRGSKIVGGIQAPQTTLIWTDTDIWSMSYIGTPLIYGFTILGSGCGLLAPHARGVLGRNTYWMSLNGFWRVGDTGVQPLPCPLWDTVFRDLDQANINKCHVAINSSANEVAFWYPSLEDSALVPVPINLLEWSQEFQNVPWVENSPQTTVVGAEVSAPDGSATAELIREGSDTRFHGVFQPVPKARSTIQYTASVYAHSSSTRLLEFLLTSNLGSINVVFDPTTGELISQTANLFTLFAAYSTTDSLAHGITILSTEADENIITEDGLNTLAGDGWLRYVVQFSSDVDSFIDFGLYSNNGSSDFYAGDGHSGIVIWGAMLNEGSVLDYIPTQSLVRNECTRYVKYNALENLWDPGFGITRTAWLDNNIFGPPLGGDENFLIQQHETGYDADGQPMRNVFAETGYNDIQDGNIIPSIHQCQPDFKWLGLNGGVNITLKMLNYPGGEPVNYGPYSATPTTQFFSTRARGKQVAVRYDWLPLLGFSARIGAMRFRVKSAGKRP